ncbi:MAG TPA: alpha/beta hydrolase [Dehalococcoidia bacterium]|nr:alpha/beta hydrolase [Dehalococcoidia bacterium]
MNTIWVDLLGAEVKYYQGKYRTRVIEAGSGEPLILIHGIGGHAEAYSRNVLRLAQHFRVMAIDLAFHGFSQKQPQDGRPMEHFVAQVIDLLDVIGVEKGYVEGESLGGWIALHLALQHPQRLKRIVLNTAAGVNFSSGTVQEDHAGGLELLRERSLAAIQNPTRETIRKRLEWLMASPDRVTEELVDIRLHIYSQPEAQQSIAYIFNTFFGEAWERYSLNEEQVSQIAVPTLVLWADKNPGHGPDAGERLSSLIKGSQFFCIRDAAHWPQWEKPEEHDQVVSQFLLSPATVAL